MALSRASGDVEEQCVFFADFDVASDTKVCNPTVSIDHEPFRLQGIGT